MKRAAGAALLLALAISSGCKSSGSVGTAVDLTIDPTGLDTAVRQSIADLTIAVDEDSSYTHQIDVQKVIGKQQVKVRYLPGAMSGSLTFHVDATDANGNIVAGGTSDSVQLVTGRTVDALVTLSGGVVGLPDLGGGDGGGDGGSGTLPKGSACTKSSDCASNGGCVDGYCCDTACKDSCHACNITGFEGTCSPLSTGVKPATGHPACGPDDVSTCGRDGTCDGAGNCRMWPFGTTCKSSTCNATTNQFTSASTCDGKGTCTAGSSLACDPFKCQDATTCFATCTGNVQCSGSNTCVNSSCGLKIDGAACTTDGECVHGHCADMVCCNAACTDTCKTCNQASALGMCTFVPPGADPRGNCPVGGGNDATCSPGLCNGAGACNTATVGTACSMESCVSGQHTLAGGCNAAGHCVIPTPVPCSPYICGTGPRANKCTQPCTGGDGDCVSNYYCDGTACQPMIVAGGTGCTRDGMCAAGSTCAIDGVCCKVAHGGCDGQCQYCDGSGNCQHTTAGTQPKSGHNGPCTSDSSYPACNGACDGTSTNCAYPTGSCFAGSCFCTGGAVQTCSSIPPQSCSNGKCPMPAATACYENTGCNAGNTACTDTCTTGTSTGCPIGNCCHSVFTGVCIHACNSTCPGGGSC